MASAAVGAAAVLLVFAVAVAVVGMVVSLIALVLRAAWCRPERKKPPAQSDRGLHRYDYKGLHRNALPMSSGGIAPMRGLHLAMPSDCKRGGTHLSNPSGSAPAGLASKRGRLPQVITHLAQVNGWSADHAALYREAVFETWASRSRRSGRSTFRFSPPALGVTDPDRCGPGPD